MTSPPKPDPDQLIHAFRSYSRAIASDVLRKLPPSIDKDDLFAAAELGLVEAARAFDPSRGVLFKTFAFYRIRGAVYDSLRKMAWFSKAQYERYKFERAANEYMTDYSASATPPGTPEEELEELQGIGASLVSCYMMSLDQMQQEVEGSDGGGEDEYQRREAEQNLKACLSTLPEKNRQVMELYYFRDISMEEIGEKLGLSKSRICRIHSKSIEMLRAALGAGPASGVFGTAAEEFP